MIGDAFGLRQAWMEARQNTQKAIADAYQAGRDYAQAEHDYQVAKAVTATKMRADGEPATFIQMAVKGSDSVADALMRRNLAESDYKVSVRAIDYYRDDARQLFDEYRRALQGDPER